MTILAIRKQQLGEAKNHKAKGHTSQGLSLVATPAFQPPQNQSWAWLGPGASSPPSFPLPHLQDRPALTRVLGEPDERRRLQGMELSPSQQGSWKLPSTLSWKEQEREGLDILLKPDLTCRAQE